MKSTNLLCGFLERRQGKGFKHSVKNREKFLKSFKRRKKELREAAKYRESWVNGWRTHSWEKHTDKMQPWQSKMLQIKHRMSTESKGKKNEENFVHRTRKIQQCLYSFTAFYYQWLLFYANESQQNQSVVLRQKRVGSDR